MSNVRAHIEDDFGGQRRPLPNVLSVSQDSSEDVGRFGSKLFRENIVEGHLDIGTLLENI